MTERKPLTKVLDEGLHQKMHHHPTRWPDEWWERIVLRARVKRVSRSEVIRECFMRGLIDTERDEALLGHARNTVGTRR